MDLRDRAFQRVFSKTFVYNILFEDSEVDERFLGIDEHSTVLGITGAGCGIAGMVSKRPESIDAVDINPHHLSLTALKVAAAQHLDDYGTFYDLFGRGWSPEPKPAVARLAHHMSPTMQRYWRRHAKRFSRSLYRQGLTSRMLNSVRRHVGVDARWLRQMAARPEAERVSEVRAMLEPIRANRMARAMLGSPLQLLALGVNFEQRDAIEATEGQPLVDFLVTHLTRVMCTDLDTNWFAWWAAAGHFNHDREDAVPPYLRRSRWETSLGAPTAMRYHNRNLFDVLHAAGRNTWSHYTLCDAIDWMPTDVQRHLFDEIRRTSRDGAVVLWRSVGDVDLVEKTGMQAFLRRMPASDVAGPMDRSRQYRQVNFYQVTH